MIADIEKCMQVELAETAKVENCFWIANNYWEKLKALIDCKGFKNENEEIDFFRNVKPQFTCYKEYFTILSEAI